MIIAATVTTCRIKCVIMGWMKGIDKSYNKRRSPSPSPSRSKLHLINISSLPHPSFTKSPASDPNRKPSDLTVHQTVSDHDKTFARRNKPTWLLTPTNPTSHPHTCVPPHSFAAKHNNPIALVANNAGSGTPLLVVRPSNAGAWRPGELDRVEGEARECRTRVPANRAWFAAESVDVRMTVFMNEGATAATAKSVTLGEGIRKRKESLTYKIPKIWRQS